MPDAYTKGVDAAYLFNQFQSCMNTPQNPFLKNSKESEDWEKGFNDEINAYQELIKEQ